MAIWTKEQPLSDRQIISLLLSNDSGFVDSFFKEGCRPLLSGINRKVFDNKLKYTYMCEHFKFHIQQNDWQRLRSVKGESSLWGWLKVTAARYFYNNRHLFLPELGKPQRPVPDRKRFDFQNAPEADVDFILSQLPDPVSQEFIRGRHIYNLEDDEIMSLYKWNSDTFKRIEKSAYMSLKTVIRNAGEYYEKLFVVPDEKIIEVGESEITVEPSVDETPRTIAKMDVQRSLVKLNDRDRYVLRSLILEDRKLSEVAKELKVTPKYLSVVRNRALKRMKDLLEN